MKARSLLWHVGVVLTVVTLVLAVVQRSWQLTLTAAAATFLLRKTSAYVPLPRVYRELGLTEEYIMRGERPLASEKAREESQKPEAPQGIQASEGPQGVRTSEEP